MANLSQDRFAGKLPLDFESCCKEIVPESDNIGIGITCLTLALVPVTLHTLNGQ